MAATPNVSAEKRPSAAKKSGAILLQNEDVELRKQKRIEQTFAAVVLSLVMLFTAVGWYTGGQFFMTAASFLQSFNPNSNQSRNQAQNCQDPKNRNTPYCQDQMRSSASTWKSVSRSWGGKAPAFKLSGSK